VKLSDEDLGRELIKAIGRTPREAVTRELASLSRLGLVEREKNALLVTDLRQLAEMVHAATSE
jgi:predicted transcriptional regulator